MKRTSLNILTNTYMKQNHIIKSLTRGQIELNFPMIFRNKTKSSIDNQVHVIRIDEWGRKSTNTIHNFSSTFSFAKQLLLVHIKPSDHCNFLESGFFKWLFGKLSA